MGIFNKIGDQFDGVKKELSDKFSDLSKETIENFDKLTDDMAESEIMNATIILSACQDSEDEDDISLKGGIMGRTKDLVALLGQAMMKDRAFKTLVSKAVQYAENNGNPSSSSSSNSSVHAMAIGPNGEKIDLDELPDEVKEGLKKMMEKDLSEKSNNKSRSKDLLDKFKDSNDSDQFSGDIDELNDEDF
jgi:hypothetical protein